MTAQLLGLHRPGHYRFKIVNQQNDLDPAVMWACVVSTEQFLCLLLGSAHKHQRCAFHNPQSNERFC